MTWTLTHSSPFCIGNSKSYRPIAWSQGRHLQTEEVAPKIRRADPRSLDLQNQGSHPPSTLLTQLRAIKPTTTTTPPTPTIPTETTTSKAETTQETTTGKTTTTTGKTATTTAAFPATTFPTTTFPTTTFLTTTTTFPITTTFPATTTTTTITVPTIIPSTTTQRQMPAINKVPRTMAPRGKAPELHDRIQTTEGREERRRETQTVPLHR